jgi:8-oxo-dGTP pyrophosphatase MutT (NUDIX family)
VDEQVRQDYLRLLGSQPDALYRDGSARTLAGDTLHLTSSAVVLDATGQNVALVWHAKAAALVQPGGHVERTDHCLQATVRREVFEETGLEALDLVGPGPALLQPHDLASTFGSCGSHWDVVFVLRADAPAEHLELRAEDRGSPAMWAPVDDLPAEVVADLPGLLARLEGYVALYGAGS